MPDVPVLSTRALNRALLARQHLLERTAEPAEAVIGRLVGLQAQNPRDPYVALWSRLQAFDPLELERLIVERGAVRLPTLRTTLHLHTAVDALGIRPLLQPVLERVLASTAFGKAARDVPIDDLLAVARWHLEDGPITSAELGLRLREHWPAVDANSLAQAVHYRLPVLQPTPRGLWTRTARPTWTTVEAWLGRDLGDPATVDEVVLRYLAAFGPATPGDARTWSGLTGLRDVFERLRPRLATVRDERGRELFDLPEAPRPPADTPARPRFLPEYDNLLLSHDDRSRVIPAEVAPRITGFVGTFLVDGFLAGQWRADLGGEPRLVLEPFAPASDDDMDELVGEGTALLAFLSGVESSGVVEFGIARKGR